jgi:hypothetical protein
MPPEFKLSSDMKEWIEDRMIGPRRKNSRAKSECSHRENLEKLVLDGKGECGVFGIPLRFDKASRTPVKGGPGQHPLSVSLDHVEPKSNTAGYRLICHFLNDVKTNLPSDLFDALVQTPAFQARKKLLKDQYQNAPEDAESFLLVWKNGRLPN